MKMLFVEMNIGKKDERIKGWLNYGRFNYDDRMIFRDGNHISIPGLDIDVITRDEVATLEDGIDYHKVIIDEIMEMSPRDNLKERLNGLKTIRRIYETVHT